MKVTPDQVTIVVPTLNEEEAIGRVIDELRAQGFDDILVVDGHSRDRTREIAEAKGARVILQRGRGKADAIATAVEHLDRPFVVIMDGDWTYPAYEIPRLLELLDGSDEVIGVRARGRENIPLVNRVGNRVITWVFNVLFGTHLTDVCSGMYALRLERLREVEFSTRGFSIEVEIAASVTSSGGEVREVPIRYRRRKGRSKLSRGLFGSVGQGIGIARDVILLAARYNPVFLIFAGGSLLLIPGILLMGWVAWELLFFGVKHHVWAIIGIALFTSGATSLSLAVLSLYLKRLELRMVRLVKEICRLGGSSPLASSTQLRGRPISR